MTYTAGLRLRLARETLDGRTPLEVTTGETPDLSEYLEFPFYGWCKFIDHDEADGRTLGRWLGPADNVGSAMTYYILKQNGKVVTRSSVVPITTEEFTSPTEIEAH
jgi:hypothetical protein